jgi:hypothetical protein
MTQDHENLNYSGSYNSLRRLTEYYLECGLDRRRVPVPVLPAEPLGAVRRKSLVIGLRRWHASAPSRIEIVDPGF